MTTQSSFVTQLVKEFGYPAWWFEVALGTKKLTHKADTWQAALEAYNIAATGSIEKAAAYAKYVRTHLVHESEWGEMNIRHYAFCKDYFERLEKTNHPSQVVAMLNEPGAIAGSYLWDEAVLRLIILVRQRVVA